MADTLQAQPEPLDPAEAAAAYAEAGADEIAFVARDAPRDLLCGLAQRLAPGLGIPLLFWTDLTSAAEVGDLLAAGAARVAIQKAALDDPNLIASLAHEFGSAAIAVAVSTAGEDEGWRVFDRPGGTAREWDALTWANVVAAQSAGSIIVESPGGGPHGGPYDLELLRSLSSAVGRPVIAAGDACCAEDLFDALMIGDVDGVIVGALLHSGRATVKQIKSFLSQHGLGVRA